MADTERCVQVGSFVWKWYESVGWYDVDDDEARGYEGVLLDEIERLRAEVERLSESLSNAMRLLSQKARRDENRLDIAEPPN